MAAPYAAAPATTPTPMPTEVPLTGEELPAPAPRGEPSWTMAAEEEAAAEPVPLLGVSPMAEPAMMGTDGLIMDIRVLVLPSGLLYSFEGGVCRSRLRLSTMSDGMYAMARVVM